MRLAVRILIGGAVLVALGMVVIGARGSFQQIAVDGRDGTASPARTVCMSMEPRPDRRLIARCVRVRGTILWVRRRYGGERHHITEIHLLVAAYFHLYVVKLHEPFPRHLRLGHGFTAVRPLLETNPSRFGIHEVEAFSFSGG